MANEQNGAFNNLREGDVPVQRCVSAFQAADEKDLFCTLMYSFSTLPVIQQCRLIQKGTRWS